MTKYSRFLASRLGMTKVKETTKEERGEKPENTDKKATGNKP
jgi:hypothetical protein